MCVARGQQTQLTENMDTRQIVTPAGEKKIVVYHISPEVYICILAVSMACNTYGTYLFLISSRLAVINLKYLHEDCSMSMDYSKQKLQKTQAFVP